MRALVRSNNGSEYQRLLEVTATAYGVSYKTVAERPGWDALAAVQNGTVIELDDDIASRWGPRIVVFVEDIAAALTLVPAAA